MKYVGFTTGCRCRFPIVPFKLADFGEGIREVTVKAILVKVGDRINQFDEVCQVESDKAAISVTSRYDGIIRKIHHDVGDVVLIGSTIVDVETSSEESEDGGPIDVATSLDDSSGREVDEEPTKTRSNDDDIDTVYADGKKALTTPAVRRIAMENKIDIDEIVGTGKGGRILKEDVLHHLTDKRSIITDNDRQVRRTENKVEIVGDRENSDKENAKQRQLSSLLSSSSSTAYRKAMVKTMTESGKIPTMVMSDEFDLTKLNRIKDDLKSIATKEDFKITLLPFFVKAVSLCLFDYPILNATYRDRTDDIILNSSHNICVAIDTPSGLVAPNMKNVQNLNVREISIELRRLQKRAIDETLDVRDITDGTFTLSNIGTIAGTVVKPLILPPQVAIGAIGKLQSLPRFDRDGNLTKSNVTVVSWAADHRVTHGAELGRFSNAVKRLLENPELFLMEL